MSDDCNCSQEEFIKQPSLRFLKFKDDWDVQKFKSNLDIKSGKGFKASEYSEDGIPLIKIDNVTYGNIKWDNKDFLPFNYFEKYPDLILEDKDIVLALNRPITNDKLKMAMLTENDVPSILYQRVGKIFVNEKELYRDFIYQLLTKEIYDFVLKNSVGSDQPFISTNQLKELEFKVPSFEEQKEIGKFLSSIDKRIDLLKELISSYEDFMKGCSDFLFKDIEYDADFKKVKDIFVSVSTRKHQIKKSEIQSVGEIPVVDQGKKDIAGYFDDFSKLCDDVPLIVFGDHTTILKYVDFEFIVGADGVKLLKPKNDDSIKYLYYALKQYNIEPEGYKRHFSILKNVELPIPSEEEQYYIVKILDVLDYKLTLLNQQLEQYLSFKKELLHRMFI